MSEAVAADDREQRDWGPPPGLEQQVQPDPPEVPPDTLLGRDVRHNSRPAEQFFSGNNDARYWPDETAGGGNQGVAAEATRSQWHGSWQGQWDDRRAQSWGSGWDSSDRSGNNGKAAAWNRHTSWDDTATTTGATVGDSQSWDPRGVDPWTQGRDPWTSWRPDNRPHSGEDQGWHEQAQAPQADGRAGSGPSSDPGDHRGGQWSSRAASDDLGLAWNGWAHYDNGGFQGEVHTRRGQTGGTRASEKLAVPTFSGDDTDDLGGSARSYLRQIEAWRRMTLLPLSQQGLVLYQNLSGKAWIAAEELSVPRLGSDEGVSYFVAWVNARFLDLEVARIGRAFSDFFRRLRRRPGQSIREYNTEYDRLHARLREVGCSLPQECAAWLYIDRLQLEEPQELNLLASVGNVYNLHRLQQAAVLHDRGHRKPWETSKTRRAHTAHLTTIDDGEDQNDDEQGRDDGELEDGVPEEVAVAFATYQSAKDKYKDHLKARGFQGDKGNQTPQGGFHNKDKARAAEVSREEKVKIMKAKSFCSSCGKKGHWHKDPECPNNLAKNVSVCHHVPAEVYTLRHEGGALVAITDTACAKSVAGTMWLQQYSDVLVHLGSRPDLVRESEAFKFGTGKIHHSSFHVVICFVLGDKTIEMKTSIINGDVPLLMSKKALADLGMVYDVAANRADFNRVNLKEFDLITTSTGHPAIPIIPSRPTAGPDRLVLDDSGVKSSGQYMAFAVSSSGSFNNSLGVTDQGPSTNTGSTMSSLSTTTRQSTFDTKAPHYRIFYDKKLSPELKELLTQDRLQASSFLGWWERTSITSDFWLEGEFAWHRIHVTPRRALCNPSTWKTQATVQRGMLLESIGNLRVTEGFCCRTGKPLEIAVDRWKDGGAEQAFSLLWIGRSTFAKRCDSNSFSPLASIPSDGAMQTSTNQQDVEDRASFGSKQGGARRAPELDQRGAQGSDSRAQDVAAQHSPGDPDEVHHELDDARAQAEGAGAQGRVPEQRDKRESPQAHPRQSRDTRNGVDEDREVQGLGVRRDSESVRDVGCERNSYEREPSRRACEVREVVGVGATPDPLRHADRGQRHGPISPRGECTGHSILGELGMDRGGLPGPVQAYEARPVERGVRQELPGPSGLGSPEDDLPDVPEATQARGLEFELRQGGHGGDGVGGRSGGARGDTRVGGEAGGPQAEGQGPGEHTPGELSRTKELLTGTFAPMSSENYGEDGEIYQDGNDLGPRPPQAQEPRHHQGNVHRPPVRDLCRSYKHIGCHFGSKTDEHRTGCCERDAQTSSSGIFLSETDPADANHHKYYNFPCAPTCQDPANLITRAIADHDCSFSTLAKVLHEADFKEVKTTRDGVFSKSGDWANYHTVGLYTHGGTYGVTNKTKDQHSLVRYINQFGKHHLGPQASWTSVTVSYNASTAVHHDFHNLRGSRNYTASFGQRRGGGLWVEDRAVREDDLPKGIKWRQAGSGHWLPGRVVDTNEKFYEFDPFLKHGTETWEGDRWCLTYHTTRNYPKIGGHLKDYLKKCGFPLPKMPKGSREAEVNRKPGRTTRKAIFNNAAKIGVMMTTLISAARSYIASLDSPQVQANPVVIFEIGGTSATQEAAELGKDVFEPMSWERYGTSEGKLDAFHIVNGGSPRELRLKLQGKQARCDEAVTELIQQQIDDGGTVVIKGEANDSLFDNQVFKQVGRPCVQYEDNNDEGVFVVLFRSKDSIITIRCPDRVHGVCAVDHDVGGGQEAVAKLGGGGITFGKDVAPSIASALRRLHQNLGHPQQDDLVRHLRLAGCEGDVLKAAKSMRCQVCEANAAPKVARPSTLPHLYDWNDTLGIDLFYAHDANDEKHTFLSVVDFGTTYHLATKVDGASADDIEAKFNEMWVVPFGPPKSVAIDLETGLQAALGRLCDWHGIGVRSVATQSHWQAGMVERQQAWWKSVWERVVYQLTVGDDEVAIAASIVNSAKNELRRRCGYSPSQWVFGKSPRTPEELQDPDGGHHALWDVTQDARHQRQSAIRAAARVAFHESQNDSRLRKALLQRTRVTSRPYDIGESVHYWHKPKNRRRGEWSGPAIIVGKEGGNYWLSKGGRCRLTSPEHMRPTTPEEVGTFLAMRNTKDEVERLLDYDPDADETYETEGEGDMIVDEDEGGGAGEIDYGGEDIILDPVEENEVEEPRPPRYRLKRKTTAEDAHPKRHEAMLLKTDLTRRGVEKRKEKELRWAEIPQEVHEKFREAERQQWQEHMSFDALEALSSEASAEVRARVPPERILRCRWAYKDKNYARRRDGEDVPWKCKSRLVIAGHTDPDLTNESLHLSTDAPTLSRCGFSCLMQITANGLQEADPWSMSAGDIRCAFLTGSYLRRELFMHQPRTGFPGMLPGQLVRIKKKCVWTCDESTRVVERPTRWVFLCQGESEDQWRGDTVYVPAVPA